MTAYTQFLDPAQQTRVSAASSTWFDWHTYRVHVARRVMPDAPLRVLVFHGAGGHSGALWPLISSVLHDQTVDIAAIDLPLYGRTICPARKQVRYEDWVALGQDWVTSQADGRPLLLLGASLGGMLAYEIAARLAPSTNIMGVVATCLLDPSRREVQRHLTRFGRLGVAGPALCRLVRGPLRHTMIPMAWIANLDAMSLNPALCGHCAADPLGGGSRVPLGFLCSYLQFRHTPAAHNPTPIHLLHPELDGWTPPQLSLAVLDQAGGPREYRVLRGCGHFPVEQPGIADLTAYLAALIDAGVTHRR